MTRYTIFKYILCITLSVLCCQSCYDDKGNYSYTNINEISFSDFEEKYTIRTGEPITIKPKLTSTLSGNENNYSYEWVCLEITIDGQILRDYVWSDLKEWDNFQIGLPGGNYDFYYRVKDNETGITWSSDTFRIVIENDIAAGFFILSDVNNKGRLDFVSYYKQEWDLKLDILTNIGTEIPSLENPIGVECYPDANSPRMDATVGEGRYLTAIMTKQGAYRINPTDFSYDELYNIRNNFVGIPPADFYVQEFFPETNSSPTVLLLSNDGSLYYYYNMWRMYWTVGVLANTISDGTRFRVSPNIAVASYTGAVMYDMDKRSFLYKSYTASYGSYFQTTSETLFKFNNTGKDLIYLHARQTEPTLNGVFYAVMKDPGTNEFFLGSFVATGAQRFYQNLNLTDLANAKEFAMTHNNGAWNLYNEFIYYRTDSKIYVYNTADYSNEVVYTAPSGSKISKMRFIREGNFRDHLMVFTYDESKPADNCGKLEVMAIKQAYGTLSIAEDNGKKMEWTGFGKVIDAEWKAR